MWKKAALHSAIATACTCAPGAVLSAQVPVMDACSVLTREEIKTLSGNRDPGAPSPGSYKPGDPVSTCYWQQASPKGSVILWSNVSPKEPKGLALKQMLDHGKQARAVPGLGDDAFFVEDPKENPGGSLYARVGHWRVIVYREADTPLAKSESVLPTLTAFAKAAVPKLRKAG
ncbi:MAG TPA: hypothetical protein VHR41_13470 [Gemmatimonadales bacterium]|jgi:hypothetical protein|nr:hypothetical protein [Gemmatimonadales bacterium]